MITPVFSPAFLRSAALALLASMTLASCASGNHSLSLFDLGPIRNQAAIQTATTNAPPSISLATIEAPAWLDSQSMFYRLDYAQQLQPRAYASSQWTMPPSQLLAQRLKNTLTRAGGVVVPAADGAVNLPVLRVELVEFSQHFNSADDSTGEVAIRASLYDGRMLRAQQTFTHQAPATSANAEGGAAALSAASDAVLQDLRTWLTTLPTHP